MTDRAAIPLARPRHGVAALLLVVLVPLLLWIGTGNTYAAHLDGGGDAHQGSAPVSVEATGDKSAAHVRAPGSVPHDADSSHVLHLLGGCIAVLGAALLLLGAWVSRERPASAGSSTPGVITLDRHARSWWRPPALSPPTTSPVLRN